MPDCPLIMPANIDKYCEANVLPRPFGHGVTKCLCAASCFIKYVLAFYICHSIIRNGIIAVFLPSYQVVMCISAIFQFCFFAQ